MHAGLIRRAILKFHTTMGAPPQTNRPTFTKKKTSATMACNAATYVACLLHACCARCALAACFLHVCCMLGALPGTRMLHVWRRCSMLTRVRAASMLHGCRACRLMCRPQKKSDVGSPFAKRHAISHHHTCGIDTKHAASMRHNAPKHANEHAKRRARSLPHVLFFLCRRTACTSTRVRAWMCAGMHTNVKLSILKPRWLSGGHVRSTCAADIRIDVRLPTLTTTAFGRSQPWIRRTTRSLSFERALPSSRWPARSVSRTASTANGLARYICSYGLYSYGLYSYVHSEWPGALDRHLASKKFRAAAAVNFTTRKHRKVTRSCAPDHATSSPCMMN